VCARRVRVAVQIPLRCPAGEQVCDQLADSVMEFGLNLSAIRFELSGHAEIARTGLRQVRNHVCEQVCDLDSVMEFSQSRSQTSSRTSW